MAKKRTISRSTAQSNGGSPTAQLESARDVEDILVALAILAWQVRPAEDGSACPPEQVPSPRSLAEWLPRCPMDALTKATALHKPLLGQFAWVPEAVTLDDKRLYLESAITCNQGHRHAHRLTKLHQQWLSSRERGVHPWFPVVQAWQRRPIVVRPNLANDPVLASKAAALDRDQSMLYAPRSVSRKDKFASLFAAARHVDATGQLSLGFGKDVRVLSPALPLFLYDNSGIHKAEKGTGREANLALRIFVESILSVPYDVRGSGLVELVITWRELETMLFGEGRKPRPNEYLPRLYEAANALESPEARVPWEDPVTGKGGLRRVVSVRDIPRRGKLDDEVRILVDLPPGCQEGPLVTDRDKLRRWGKTSAAVYRLKLNLYWRWFFPGQTRFPVGRGKRRVWMQSQEPEAYGDPVTDAELVSLCFPAASGFSGATLRDLKRRARGAIDRLIQHGEARLVEGRILPPAPSGQCEE